MQTPIIVTYAHREAFLSQYFEENGTARLYAPEDQRAQDGEETALEIYFTREQTSFRTRAVPRRQGASPARGLLCYEFPPRQKRTLDMLVSFLRGSEIVAKRRAPRFRVSIVCDVAIGGQFQPTHIEDIGKGGAYLIANDEPDVGTRVTLRFPASYLGAPVQIEGEVAWKKRGALGFGISFLPLGLDVQDQLDQLLVVFTSARR